MTLYVSEDGGGYQIWQDQVTMASGTMIYQGQAGHTYTFLALATDVAGNHELPPAGTNAPQDTDHGQPRRFTHGAEHHSAQLRHSACADRSAFDQPAVHSGAARRAERRLRRAILRNS